MTCIEDKDYRGGGGNLCDIGAFDCLISTALKM